MDSISLFLEKDVLPEEKSEADKVQRKAPRFWLFEDRKLYKLKQGYDMSVKLRPLAPRDLVLRKVVGNTKNSAWGKLGPN